MVNASLAMLPLKNLHLRHSQTAAARSQVDPNPWFPVQDTPLGEAGPSPAMSIFLLWSSSGGDLEPDSGNTLGH